MINWKKSEALDLSGVNLAASGSGALTLSAMGLLALVTLQENKLF